MTTIPIHILPYLRPYTTRVQAARDAANGHTPTTITMRHTAADAITLRGIPAVGRAMAGGHIAGTQPEAATCR